MKILRIKASGLPLFNEELDIKFYSTQRVSDDDRTSLIEISKKPALYLNPSTVFIGINASGKTSVLKVLEFSLRMLNSEPINHISVKSILGNCEKAQFEQYFLDVNNNICLLKTIISSNRTINGEINYSIVYEEFYEKSLDSVSGRKYLCDFDSIEPKEIRNNTEMYLSDDVSIVIGHNKAAADKMSIQSLLSYTNINVLPYIDNISPEIISFLDPTVEKIWFENESLKRIVHLKFYGKDEIILNSSLELEKYLSSGTIKGIVVFTLARAIIQSGGYLIIDEIENHFNNEIVATLIRFFRENRVNVNSGSIIYSTHHAQLLDEYDRNDSIYITRNNNGITARNLSESLSRNDIKKSDVYRSDLLQGTAPNYETYAKLRKSFESK